MYSILQKRSHKIVENALLRCDIIRATACEACGKECKPHAHHDDYNKPLQIRWLCSSCHSVIHPGNRVPIASRIAHELQKGLIY